MEVAELQTRTERMQRELDDHARRLADVEKSHSINDVVMNQVDKRLASIEDTLKWIVRLIIGAILTGLITALIALALSRGINP